jgi:MarR family transcriptional regulator, 2-MHQ and catechol-resistance regulon repressor
MFPLSRISYAFAMADDLFDDPRLTAMGLLIEVHGGLTARLDPVLSSHGFSGNDFDVLIRVARSPGRQLRMTDLATQTGLSTSGITRVVDRLETSGLVCRQACAHDRRSFMAVLTDAGAGRLAALLPELLDGIERHFTSLLTPERLDAFLTVLRVLRDHVRPGAAAGAERVQAPAS